MKLFKSKSGFTLIELLVVIGILAVLAAIAIPSVAGLIDRANVSADKTNANEMTNAIERFTSEYELYCQDIASGVIDANTTDFDAAQGRVYNVTQVKTRSEIETLEVAQGASVPETQLAIYRDTKYPVNATTLKAIVENYTKTSSATFDPKQSDMHFWYSPACGVVVVATPESSVVEKNDMILSGVDAKGRELDDIGEVWIDLTNHNPAPAPDNQEIQVVGKYLLLDGSQEIFFTINADNSITILNNDIVVETIPAAKVQIASSQITINHTHEIFSGTLIMCEDGHVTKDNFPIGRNINTLNSLNAPAGSDTVQYIIMHNNALFWSPDGDHASQDAGTMNSLIAELEYYMADFETSPMYSTLDYDFAPRENDVETFFDAWVADSVHAFDYNEDGYMRDGGRAVDHKANNSLITTITYPDNSTKIFEMSIYRVTNQGKSITKLAFDDILSDGEYLIEVIEK